jgi:transcriptional regulator with XRE-family HTH domain
VEPAGSWSDVGERVRQARLASGLTQAELAARIGLERSALVRVEGGGRRLDAMELFRLSDALGLPIAHFVTRPPAAVVSRRAALPESPDVATRERYLVDADLEAHLADTQQLVDDGLLVPPPLAPPAHVATAGDARALALDARARLGLKPTDPLGPAADACEHFGLYLLVVDRDADGASLLGERFGVAVVGGRAEPGRRRFTAAHELGHHLLGDAYTSDLGVATSSDEREAVVDAFAGELLLPAPAVHAAWGRAGPARDRLVWLAGTFRVSWSVAVGAARFEGLVGEHDWSRLRADTPRRGEFIAVTGGEPAPDLLPGQVGASWQRAVLAGWRRGDLTAGRTVELLRHRLQPDDLPERAPYREI